MSSDSRTAVSLREQARQLSKDLGYYAVSQKYIEGKVREAMALALKEAEQAVRNALYDDRGPMDLRDAQALKDATNAIASLQKELE